jgi:hypothetical protein
MFRRSVEQHSHEEAQQKATAGVMSLPEHTDAA